MGRLGLAPATSPGSAPALVELHGDSRTPGAFNTDETNARGRIRARGSWLRSGFGTGDGRWEPFTLGVSPAGAYVAGLEPHRTEALPERCRDALPGAPFVRHLKLQFQVV